MSEINETALANIHRELSSYKENITAANAEKNSGKFFQIITGFRTFLATIKDESLCDRFFESPNFKVFFRKYNNRYMKGIEISEVKKMLGGKKLFTNQEHLISEYNERKTEISMFNLPKINSIAVVGCGALSHTMLYCHQHTDIENILGVDHCAKAIEYSYKFADLTKMDRSDFIQMDAQEYNYINHDAVYIAGFSHPKDEILKQISKTARRNTQVIVDDCLYLQKIIYDGVNIDPNYFDVMDTNYTDTLCCNKKITLLRVR